MIDQTLVQTDSIQNIRITEIRESLNVNKTFSYLINTLKDDDSNKIKYSTDKIPLEPDNVAIADQRVQYLGENKIQESRNYYTQTQKWLGTIIQIDNDGFLAKLEDLTNGGNYEVADFLFSEVSKDDKSLIALGNVFYWSVGYANDKGQVKKESIIRFQRLPKWTTIEMDEVFDKVKKQNTTSEWL